MSGEAPSTASESRNSGTGGARLDQTGDEGEPPDDRDAAFLISDPDAHIRKAEQHLNLPPLGAS